MTGEKTAKNGYFVRSIFPPSFFRRNNRREMHVIEKHWFAVQTIFQLFVERDDTDRYANLHSGKVSLLEPPYSLTPFDANPGPLRAKSDPGTKMLGPPSLKSLNSKSILYNFLKVLKILNHKINFLFFIGPAQILRVLKGMLHLMLEFNNVPSLS